MKKPKAEDYKNCIDPEFAYLWASLNYTLMIQAKKNAKLFKKWEMLGE